METVSVVVDNSNVESSVWRERAREVLVPLSASSGFHVTVFCKRRGEHVMGVVTYKPPAKAG